MQLEFTEEQDELRAGVRSVLERECPIALIRSIVEGDGNADALWKHMVDLGWPALTVPKWAGGLGLGAVELAVVVEELGRVMAPGPLLATTSQFVPAVREAGDAVQQARFLATVAEGECTGSLALAEPGCGYDPAHVAATASPDGAAWRLAGTKVAVVDGATVDEIVVVARVPGTSGDDGVGAFVVPRGELAATPIAGLDPSRGLTTFVLDAVTIPGDRMLGEPGAETAAAVRRAVEEATAALALETVGTCQTIFDVTLEYAKERRQFDVPIGSFQAIKHKFADMAIMLERARATGYFAALTIAEDDDRRALAASTAKAAAGDCQQRVAKEGIQIHGGMGYTWEHDMHLYVRRVKTNAQLFGTTPDHHARIAGLLGV